MAGGILVIQSARLGPRCDYYEEGENKGVYYSNTYRCGKKVITIAATYWPYDKDERMEKEHCGQGLREDNSKQNLKSRPKTSSWTYALKE